MNTSPAPHLSARDLHRSFRIARRTIEVLRGASLDVPKGQTVFLTGKSGAGKSTLLYTLAGLERPERGSVSIAGQPLYTGRPRDQERFRNRHIGFVFQSYFLVPELTALENVMLPGMIGGCPDPAASEAMLARVGLAGRLGHLPAELSGGEQQRVALARALVREPDILFADEPTGNLDAKTGSEIVDLLLGIVRERSATLVVVTHDRSLAARGDRHLHIEDGALAEVA